MTLTYKQFKIEVAPIMESCFNIARTRFRWSEQVYSAYSHPVDDSPFLFYCHDEEGWLGARQGQWILWTTTPDGQDMNLIYDRLPDLVEDNKSRL